MNTNLAIDIGGTFTKIGIVDEIGEILVFKVFSTKSIGAFASFLKELLAETIGKVLYEDLTLK